MPEELLLNVLQNDDFAYYGVLKSCSKALSTKILAYNMQYNIMERFLDAEVGSTLSVGLNLAFKDSLSFTLERFPRDTAISMVVNRVTKFGRNSREIVELCAPFLKSLDEEEKENFSRHFLLTRPLHGLAEFDELAPLILGSPDHLIGRIILSRISVDNEDLLADWGELFHMFPGVLEAIKMTGSKLMMTMYLVMRGLMSLDGGIASPDFPDRNYGFIRSFSALRQLLTRSPICINLDNLVERIMPPQSGIADLNPLARIMTSFCWVNGRGFLHGLAYIRYLFPANVAECPDMSVPLAILNERKQFELRDLSPGQVKFLRLFDHTGSDIDQQSIDMYSSQCINDATSPDTVRFLCKELYATSTPHMSALFDAVHAALDFSSPKKLFIFRSPNHQLAWSCLVVWVHSIEKEMVVETAFEILKEMHDVVEGGINCELVHGYKAALYETPELRTALSSALCLLPAETRKTLDCVYHLSGN